MVKHIDASKALVSVFICQRKLINVILKLSMFRLDKSILHIPRTSLTPLIFHTLENIMENGAFICSFGASATFSIIFSKVLKLN